MSGIMTKVWGPGCWIFLHCLVTGYPDKIDLKNRKHQSRRKHTIQFFKHFAHILPCKYCRESFIEFSKEMPIEEYVNSNHDLCFWLYTMHNKVNDKLGIKENVPTFKQVCKKYTTYKASCDKVKKGCIKGDNNISKHCKISIESFQSPKKKLTIEPELFELKDFDDVTKTQICTLCAKIIKANDIHLLKKMHRLLKKINRIEWLIFGKEACPYCQEAKEFAKQKKLNFTYIDIETMYDKDKKQLFQLANKPVTIPIIFRLVNNKYKYIGGLSEIKRFKKNKF